MTLVERLKEVKKRLGLASEIKSLRPEDWQAVLVSVIRDCQRDGAEAEREACAKISDDEARQWDKDGLGECAALAIGEKIRARGEKAGWPEKIPK